jgi:dipeptidyl aminopeptidase/acylaminoacyl peptidase
MYGVNFDFERQWLAAQGYLVLYTNPRGSTGYGKAFACGIQNAYPGKDYDDLMTGVEAVINEGFTDPDNLFVYGGSGGGVLTCWIVGTTNRFRAAVSMFPVTNWISFVGTTDGPYWYTNFKKLPWQDVSEHWQRSPLRLVGNVQTPTMLITGELDLRTPMAQTEEYYQALKLRKVDTVLVRIQDEYHGAGTRHPSNRLRRMLYTETWFRKHRAGSDNKNDTKGAPSAGGSK